MGFTFGWSVSRIILELDKVTPETFAPYLRQTFRIDYGGTEPLLTELSELNVAGEHLGRDNRRLPFSLVFRGGRGSHLPQRLYRVEHEALGALDIFLVPLGPDSEGIMRYEAVFG